MKPLIKTLVVGTGIATLGLGSLNLSYANSPRSNAPQVEDVTLSQPGINIHLTLKNTSADKHISKVKIEPESNSISLPLQGYVKCAKDKNIEYVSSKAYFGTVTREGENIKELQVLHKASYNPSFAVWTGLIGGWVTEGGNGQPFVVPLDKVKNGHPAVRFDPMEVFNNKMNEFINNGGSKLEYLKSDRVITVNRPVSLAGTCNEKKGFSENDHGSGYITASLPITMKYKGDPALKGGMDQGGMAQGLAAKFMVTSAKVTPHDKDYVGHCPADLKFRISIKTQGTGTVKYRIVNQSGAKGPVNTMIFNEADLGHKIKDFTHQVGQPVNGGGIKGFLNNNQQPQQGNINQYAQAPTDKKTGSWRVEIVEPSSHTYGEEYYSWRCTPKPVVDGPGQIKMPEPKPSIGDIKAKPIPPVPNPGPAPAVPNLQIQQAPEPQPMQIKAQ